MVVEQADDQRDRSCGHHGDDLAAKVAFVLASGTHMYLMCKELAAGCVKMTFSIT